MYIYVHISINIYMQQEIRRMGVNVCSCVRICMCLPTQRGVLGYVCQCLCAGVLGYVCQCLCVSVYVLNLCDRTPPPYPIYTHVFIHVDACVIHDIHCLIHAAALTQCTADSAVAGASAAHRVLAAACYYASTLNTSTSAARKFLAPVKNVLASTGAWPGGSV